MGTQGSTDSSASSRLPGRVPIIPRPGDPPFTGNHPSPVQPARFIDRDHRVVERKHHQAQRITLC